MECYIFTYLCKIIIIIIHNKQIKKKIGFRCTRASVTTKIHLKRSLCIRITNENNISFLFGSFCVILSPSKTSCNFISHTKVTTP